MTGTGAVAGVAAAVVGTTFVTEDTGGGWLCLVARLEGGVVLVLSDGMGGVDFARGYLAAGVYRSEVEWQDSGYEPLTYVDTTRPDDAAEVRRVVRAALDGAVGRMC